MGTKGTGYKAANVAVIFITVLWFIHNYRYMFRYSGENSPFSDLLLAGMVFLVHLIKMVRLYLALYGTGISRSVYLKTYCKTAAVSTILPFKLGEFFRMYCYGWQARNMLRGIVVICLDRFMDTSALVTMVLLVWGIYGGRFAPVTCFFLLFLAALLLAYHVFPGIYHFWKKNLLRADVTKNKLHALQALEDLQMVYGEVRNTLQGRGIILYFLSLAAWAVEIGNIAVMNHIVRKESMTVMVSEYLMSAVGGKTSLELDRFIFVSAIWLLFGYLTIGLYGRVKGGDK